jgi:recombination endonuclease VII
LKEQLKMIATKSKQCTSCLVTKVLEEFYADKKTKDRKSCYCKLCLRERASKWQKKNPERAAARVAKWHNENPGKRAAHMNKYYASGAWRENWYMGSYGLTVAQVDKMVADQGGKCAICSKSNPGGRGRRLVVDHCHKTGMIRAMLCHTCNTSLGGFMDDPEILMKAVDYIKKYKKP